MNTAQPVFTFEIPFEEARAAAEAQAAAEHAAGMAEWQARVDAMLAEREARRKVKADAKAAAEARRVLLKAAREKAQAEEESRKSWNRFKRDTARRYKHPDEHAQCGINWYCRSQHERDKGTYWTHCKTCGQALIYTSDRNAKPQECKGRQ